MGFSETATRVGDLSVRWNQIWKVGGNQKEEPLRFSSHCWARHGSLTSWECCLVPSKWQEAHLPAWKSSAVNLLILFIRRTHHFIVSGHIYKSNKEGYPVLSWQLDRVPWVQRRCKSVEFNGYFLLKKFLTLFLSFFLPPLFFFF